MREADLGLLESWAKWTAARRAGPVKPAAVEGSGVAAVLSTGVNHFVAAAGEGKDRCRNGSKNAWCFLDGGEATD